MSPDQSVCSCFQIAAQVMDAGTSQSTVNEEEVNTAPANTGDSQVSLLFTSPIHVHCHLPFGYLGFTHSLLFWICHLIVELLVLAAISVVY